MRVLQCTQCGAPLEWDGNSKIVRCSYCGAEFLMHPREEKARNGRNGDKTGIPMGYIQGTNFQGLCPIESYVPAGWSYGCTIASSEYYGDMSANPIVVEARYSSPDGKALIIYRSSNPYTDRRLSSMPPLPSAPMIDAMVSNMRVGTPFDAKSYCDFIVQRDIQVKQGRAIKEESADREELGRWETIRKNYEGQGFSDVRCDWTRKTYSVVNAEGRPKTVCAETRVVDLRRRQQVPMGGLFGGMMNRMAQTFEEHFWETQYELILAADPDVYDAVFPEYMKINLSLQIRPEFEQMRQFFLQAIQREMAVANQAMAQMAADRMASWDRMSQTIQDTHNYTMGVMHEMQANTAATHDRVANLHSEAIRGVNTYYTGNNGYGEPSVVEADVKWDHVYQNATRPTEFVATRDFMLENGVDFEELKRTNGNYR